MWGTTRLTCSAPTAPGWPPCGCRPTPSSGCRRGSAPRNIRRAVCARPGSCCWGAAPFESLTLLWQNRASCGLNQNSQKEPLPPPQRDAGGGFLLRGPHPRLACRLGRFAAERYWRSLTPLPLISFVVRGNLAATGGGILFFFSQGGLWPPWESPFSMGPASLHGGGVLKILERPSAEGFSCPCPHESSLTAVQTYYELSSLTLG